MTESWLLARADAIAAAAHAGQLDKAGQPYIDHPRAVAELVREHGPNAVMAALLHDTVEDTDVTLDQLRAEGFPAEVVDAVDAVTRREGETYMDFIRRARRHPLGRVVKTADNLHNSSRLGNLHGEEREFLTRRYERARAVLLADDPA